MLPLYRNTATNTGRIRARVRNKRWGVALKTTQIIKHTPRLPTRHVRSSKHVNLKNNSSLIGKERLSIVTWLPQSSPRRRHLRPTTRNTAQTQISTSLTCSKNYTSRVALWISLAQSSSSNHEGVARTPENKTGRSTSRCRDSAER